MKTFIIAVAASAFSLGAFAASHAEKSQAGRLGAGRHDDGCPAASRPPSAARPRPPSRLLGPRQEVIGSTRLPRSAKSPALAGLFW